MGKQDFDHNGRPTADDLEKLSIERKVLQPKIEKAAKELAESIEAAEEERAVRSV